MKKFLAAFAVLAAVAAAWWWLRPPPVAPDAPAATVAAAEIARAHLEARARGEVDVSPCSAAGRITDATTGRGLAGALVLLRPRGLGAPTLPGESGAPLTAITDDGGDWTIPALAPGRYVLTASAAGHLPAARSDLSLRSGGPNPGLDLALAPGGHPLSGTVTDVGGGPIEGAVLTVEREGDANLINLAPTNYPALTDADGKFTVQVADGRYAITAWHPDYSEDHESADIDGGPRTVELRLTPAATIEGVVRTASGEQIAGAIVSTSSGVPGGNSAETDERGRFRLTGLRSGLQKLEAVAAHHSTRTPQPVEVGIGEAVTGVEILVDGGAFKISGFVVPKDDPKGAIDGVMVAAYTLSPMAMRIAGSPSAVDGHFEILGVRPGTYSLGSVAADALPEILGGPTIEIKDADVTDAVVQLDRGVTLAGRVEPPAPAVLSLASAEEDAGLLSILSNIGNAFVRTRADPSGAFRLRPVKPGPLRIVAEAPDGSRGELDVEISSAGRDDLVVVLTPRATVTGHISDARGAPLTGGSVEFQPLTRKPDNGFSFNSRNDGAPIAEDGSYTLRGLDGGEHEVRILDRAGNVIRWADENIKYKPARRTIAAQTDNPGLNFSVEVRDGQLRGVVVDEHGAPVPDAWVTASPEQASDAESRFHRPDDASERTGEIPELPRDPKDGDFASFTQRGEPVLSGETGRFNFTGLARRSYTLRAEALRGSARAELRGVALGSDVELQVVPLAELTGVVRSRGAPVTRYELQARRSGSFSRDGDATDHPGGTFSLDHLDPGEYTITVTADAGVLEHTLTLTAGDHHELTLDLQPWGKLRGTLLDRRSGAPIAGAVLIAENKGFFSGGDFLGTMLGRGPRTAADGRFDLARVAPGEGTVRFTDSDLSDNDGIAEAKYRLDPGQDLDLGPIHGVDQARVPKPERGDLGLRLFVATSVRRPRPPGEVAAPLTKPEDPAAAKHLYVVAVTIDGPADRAGVQPGDEVLAIDAATVASLGPENAVRLLAPAAIRQGQALTLELERAGAQRSVTLAAAPRDNSRPR